MSESKEYCITKYLSKFKAAYPTKPPPTSQEIEKYIDERWSRDKHIVYPLAGTKWSQWDFDAEWYKR
jgi:hypothetical protein